MNQSPDEMQSKLLNDVFENINDDLESIISESRIIDERKSTTTTDHDYIGMVYMGFSKYFDILANNLDHIEYDETNEEQTIAMNEVRDLFANEAMRRYIGYDFSKHKIRDPNKLKNLDLKNLAEYLNNVTSEHIRKIRINAFIDGLTKLYNQIFIKNKLIESISESKYKKISTSMIDIDFFKAVNDIYGHQIGDHVLREMSKIMEDTVGKEGIVARYGGEEFFIIVYDKDKNQTYDLVEEIRSKVESHDFKIKGKIDFEAVYDRFNDLKDSEDLEKKKNLSIVQERFDVDIDAVDAMYEQGHFDALESYLLSKFRLTISGGVAEYPIDLKQARQKTETDSEKAYAMIGMADKACISAKNKGRNRILRL